MTKAMNKFVEDCKKILFLLLCSIIIKQLTCKISLNLISCINLLFNPSFSNSVNFLQIETSPRADSNGNSTANIITRTCNFSFPCLRSSYRISHPTNHTCMPWLFIGVSSFENLTLLWSQPDNLWLSFFLIVLLSADEFTEFQLFNLFWMTS